MQEYQKIRSKRYPDVFLRVIPGHFVTPHAHINYYMDMSVLKSRQGEAHEIAKAIASEYRATTIVDTILCMDDTQVIGAYLADELTQLGVMSINKHKTMYVVSPEFDNAGQMIFRQNADVMIANKHVLVLVASATTGETLSTAIESIKYYGGTISGISALFSAANKAMGIDIHTLFDKSDFPDYAHYDPDHCKMCKAGRKIDAIANGFGYSAIL